MKDAVGNTIEIDNKVVCSVGGYTCELRICTVIGFTKQKVKLKRNNSEFLKFPEQIAVVIVPDKENKLDS